MVRRSTRRFATWLCLVAYLFAGVFQAPGVVLCIEADGHLAIEWQCDGFGCCSNNEAEQALAAEGDAVAQATKTTECRCTDVPLFVGRDESAPQLIAKSSIKSLKKSPVAGAAECQPMRCWQREPSAPPTRGFVEPPWRVNTLLKIQRSVVLLI